MKINKNKLILKLFGFLICITVLSQINSIELILRPAMYGCWILFFIILFVIKNGKIFISNFSKFYIFSYLFFIIFILISLLFGLYDEINISLITIFIIPLIVSVVGENLLPENKNIIYIYIYISLIFALWINIEFFSDYRGWLENFTYLYGQKNSAAQIWGTAVLLIFFYIKPKGFIKKFILYSIGFYFIFMIIMTQCKTAMLALVIVTFYYFLKVSRHRILLLISSIFLIYTIIFIPNVQDFFVHALSLDKYSDFDANKMSAGRLDFYSYALAVFKENPFVGDQTVNFPIDNFYLNVLTKFGVIGFIPIMFIWIYLIFKNYFLSNKDKNYFILVLLTIFYIVESLLEGNPPFGPGVSSFMFWLLSASLYQRYLGEK